MTTTYTLTARMTASELAALQRAVGSRIDAECVQLGRMRGDRPAAHAWLLAIERKPGQPRIITYRTGCQRGTATTCPRASVSKTRRGALAGITSNEFQSRLAASRQQIARVSPGDVPAPRWPRVV